MMRTPLHALFLSLFIVGMGCSLQAQDVHFTQYMYTPLQLNPAHTGLFAGDYRLVGNYRNQWFSVPVPYSTLTASFDARLRPQAQRKGSFALGGLLLQDQQGDAQLTTTQVLLSGAYILQLSRTQLLSVGLQTGYGQRRLDLSALRFDDQYDGEVYNAALLSADLNAIERTNFSYLDVNAGINYRLQYSARTWFNLGVSVAHVNTPRQRFFSTTATQLPSRLLLLGAGCFRIAPLWDLMPSFLVAQQEAYQEFVGTALLRYHFNQAAGRELALGVGSAYRIGDATSAIVGIDYQNIWHFGLSYDINTSAFRNATRNHGAVELSLIYIWRRLPQLPTVKTCPIF